MKKFNKKQKNILRLAATFFFCLALVLILNLAFNKNKVDKKYTGLWVIGYNFYNKENNEELLYSFVQELHLLKDKTFYTKDINTPANANETSIQGKYEISDNKITFRYEQNGQNKTNILIYKDDKLCTNVKCETYYVRDKVDKYFSIYNASIETKED